MMATLFMILIYFFMTGVEGWGYRSICMCLCAWALSLHRQTVGFVGQRQYFARYAFIFFVRVVGNAYLVEQAFRLHLVQLQPQRPRVVAQEQPRELLVGEHRNAAALFVVGFMLHFGNGVLPFVHKHGAAGAVGENKIGLVGFHGDKLLFGVGNGVASIFAHQILPKAKAAAVTALGIVHHFAAPSLNHAGQHIGKFGFADALSGKNLCIVAPNVLHHAQRTSRETVHQTVAHALFELETKLVDDVARVHNVARHLKLSLGGLPQVLPRLLFESGVVLPLGHHLGENAKRGDARRHIVLVAGLGHQREEPRHDGHRGVEGHHVAVVAYARAGVLVGVVADVLAQLLAQHLEKSRLRAGKKGLTDATPLIEIAVVGNLFLIFVPKTFLHSYNKILYFNSLFSFFVGAFACKRRGPSLCAALCAAATLR